MTASGGTDTFQSKTRRSSTPPMTLTMRRESNATAHNAPTWERLTRTAALDAARWSYRRLWQRALAVDGIDHGLVGDLYEAWSTRLDRLGPCQTDAREVGIGFGCCPPMSHHLGHTTTDRPGADPATGHLPERRVQLPVGARPCSARRGGCGATIDLP
jgi:hypothetical protein